MSRNPFIEEAITGCTHSIIPLELIIVHTTYNTMTISEKRTHFMKILKYKKGKETTEISKDGLLTIKKNPWAGKKPQTKRKSNKRKESLPQTKKYFS